MTENVLRWVGGKWDLAPFIISKFPPHKKYVEVFMGGGNIFARKELSEVNVINDLNGNLINLYRVIKDPELVIALEKEFETCVYSRARFDFYRELYKNVIDWAQYGSVYKAFAYMYMNRCSFNGMMLSYARRDDSSTLYRLDSAIRTLHRKFQAGKTVIEQLPFEELLADISWKDNTPSIKSLRYDSADTFIYLDPPYIVTTEPGNTYYEKLMKMSEHLLLRDILVMHKKAKWCMSYDNHKKVLELYDLKISDSNYNLFTSEKYPGINAVLTEEMHQSSSSANDEQIFKRELLIANYGLANINTLFE